MKKNIFILLNLINFILTQVSVESIPKSLLLNNNLIPQEIILPEIDLEQLIEEDVLERRSGITKPYRFAKTIEVDFNMTNSGTWSILEDGSAIWQLKIRSASAYSLNLIYDIFIYDMEIGYIIWGLLQKIIKHNSISSEDMTKIYLNTFSFLQYYNNNYRPIYHLERYLYILCKVIHEL